MSVLIKGLKMPTSCLKGGCPVDGFSCQLWEDKYWSRVESPEKMRHKNCPLIELPDEDGEIDKWWERSETVNVMAKLRAYESGKCSAEPKRGKWIAVEYNDGTVHTECSVCGYGRGVPPVRNYCPNCGARMDE